MTDETSVAEPEAARTPDDPLTRPRKLIVFADGTGNAFTRQESNIWRLYQALDRQSPDQKALYIQGVGTAGNSLIAKLDGATGFGVPSNVRKLYRFLCWNWRPNDEIYMFGFSRGAFTIRSLAGLIASQGLMPWSVDARPVAAADLKANAMGAWRAYRAETAPFRWGHFFQDAASMSPAVALTRHVRDLSVTIWRKLVGRPLHSEVLDTIRTSQPERRPGAVPIRFLGLFDTVEAYGLPVEELRGVVNWAIWPISFRNRRCSPIVHTVSHALSLDDERTTFHPIRFDQTPRCDASGRPIAGPEIREVWFAGVHSDVGGGYSDDSLAFLALGWIAEQAKQSGLRFDEAAIDRLAQRQSALTQIHNSREGLGTLYRYDPRRITAAAADGFAPIIHHSVAEKIVFGSGGYAPISLPAAVRVLNPAGGLEPIEGLPVITTMDRRETAPSPAQSAIKFLQRRPPDKELVERAKILVLWRRVTYFLMMTATFAIALMPVVGPALDAVVDFFKGSDPTDTLDASVDGIVAFAGRWIGSFLPGFLSPWIDALREHSIPMLLCLLAWYGFYLANGSLHDRIRDTAYEAWVAHGPRPTPLPRILGALIWAGDKLRLGPVWQIGHSLFARFVVPLVFTLALVLGLGVAVSRTTMHVLTTSGRVCESDLHSAPPVAVPGPRELGPGERIQSDGFSPARMCWPTGVQVRKGQTYTLWIDQLQPFVDRTIVAPAGGFQSESWAHIFAQKTLRRWTDAAWFQPIAQIGSRAEAEFPLEPMDGKPTPLATAFDGIGKTLKIDLPWTELEEPERARFEAHLQTVARNQGDNSANRFVTRFTATADGPLFLYVNDAAMAVPILGSFQGFYRNNAGAARVTIRREKPEPLPPAQLVSPQ